MVCGGFQSLRANSSHPSPLFPMGRQVGKAIGLRLKMAMGSSTRNTLWGRMMNMWKHWRTLKWKRNRRSLRLKREGGMTRRPTWRAKSRQCRMLQSGQTRRCKQQSAGGRMRLMQGPRVSASCFKSSLLTVRTGSKEKTEELSGLQQKLARLGRRSWRSPKRSDSLWNILDGK